MERTRPTVFIVEDDDSVRRSLQRLMLSVGQNVEVFATAEEFLQFLGPVAPGCLVLDLNLPGMSGLELQARLSSEGCEVPVIIITAYGDDRTRRLAMGAGAVDFLHKPFEERDLLGAVARALCVTSFGGPDPGSDEPAGAC
jgi:FixJ family two-component response regulator